MKLSLNTAKKDNLPLSVKGFSKATFSVEESKNIICRQKGTKQSKKSVESRYALSPETVDKMKMLTTCFDSNKYPYVQKTKPKKGRVDGCAVSRRGGHSGDVGEKSFRAIEVELSVD